MAGIWGGRRGTEHVNHVPLIITPATDQYVPLITVSQKRVENGPLSTAC
jgi:hypothetical protein